MWGHLHGAADTVAGVAREFANDDVKGQTVCTCAVAAGFP